MITIRVYGQTLLSCVEDPEIQCELDRPVLTVRDLLEAQADRLGSNILEFMRKSELLVTVNQKVSTLETKVKDGDVVKLTHQFHPQHDGALWHNP
ncbi:MAG: hypothetical protein D6704_00810 [Nitrospirae bacterium]|nr:MAG: hypothetical protein D6704_00810 [Nitrospirota bacterium]